MRPKPLGCLIATTNQRLLHREPVHRKQQRALPKKLESVEATYEKVIAD